jgi:hypothetical protein
VQLCRLLTNEALKDGIFTTLYDVLGAVEIVRAPGGKLIAIEDNDIINASVHSIGVAFKDAFRNIWNGFDLMENKSSIVEIFIVCTLNRCQRYWEKATASDAFRAAPKAFAKTFEAVEIYDWGAIRKGPSAFLPSRNRNSMRCVSAIITAEA